MEKRELGQTGMQVSVISLGCWAMGGQLWGPADDAASVAAIARALDRGINLIDTAPVYGFGHSEEVVGQGIRGRRDQVYISTKCGLKWDDQGNVTYDASRPRILQEIDDSLRRLQVDYIDLYQIHWPDPAPPIEEYATIMAELQQQGKIKAIGVSNFTVEQMAEMMKYCRIDSLQPPYNMFLRQIEEFILPFCHQHNIGVISYGPMYQGMLTGKFFLDGRTPTDPLRAQHSEFRPERFDVNRDALLKLKDVADDLGVDLAQLAINWVICQPGITSAICGARNPQQVEDNVAAASWRLSAQDLARIDEILQERLNRLESRGQPVQA